MPEQDKAKISTKSVKNAFATATRKDGKKESAFLIS